MALLETLILTVGTAVAKSLLDVWLKEDPVLGAAATTTLDVIKSKTSDILAIRKVNRQFETLADRVATSLEPIFKSYGYDAELDPSRSPIEAIVRDEKNTREVKDYRAVLNWEAVAIEVSSAIYQARVSARLLARLNYDPVLLDAHIRASHPDGARMFSEIEKALYLRSISLGAQYIIDLAPALPNYTSSNFTELLTRLDASMVRLDEIMTNLDSLREASEGRSNEKLISEFEADYRASVVRKLDRVDLLGMDLERELKRYPLSVAYISLEVHRGKSRTEPSEERLSVEEALAGARCSVIVGEAGSGKTTLLKWLAIKSAENSFPRSMSVWANTVPFFIELRRYRESFPSPQQFLDQLVPEIAGRMPARWVHDALASGKGVLLIDGLDEVSFARRDLVLEWLEGLLHTYRKTRVVLTSRPAAYSRDWLKDLKFKEFSLASMEYGATEMFVEYWHRAVLIDKRLESEDQALLIQSRLLEKFRNNISLMRLATNPLLCAMLCALHYGNTMHLPADRNELYEKCIAMLLERRDIERDIALGPLVHLRYRQKRVLLDDLAYWMIKNGLPSVEVPSAVNRIAARLGNMNLPIDATQVPDVLRTLVERSGLLRMPSEDTLDFVHRTFQEYMAASAASADEDWGLLVKNSLDDQWQDTIILAAGFASQYQASKLIDDILRMAESHEDKRIYLQLLAVSCYETATEVNDVVRHQVREVLSALIPSHDRKQDRFLAAAGDLAVPYLKSRPDFSTEDATSCIGILGMIGTPAALTALGTYVNDTRKGVPDAVLKVMRGVSPIEIPASGLSQTLLQSLVNTVEKGCLRVDGDLLHALSEIPLAEWGIFTNLVTDTLEIRRFRPDHLSILRHLAPTVKSLMLSGYLRFDIELITMIGLRLEALELRNKGRSWPDFSAARHLHGLSRLCLASNPDAELDFTWPDFSSLSYLPDLTSFGLISVAGDDLPDLNELVDLKEVRHLFLAIDRGSWTAFDRLNELTNLRVLELSCPWKRLPTTQRLSEISDVRTLKKLILNVDRLPDETRKLFTEKARFCGLKCEIELREGLPIRAC